MVLSINNGLSRTKRLWGRLAAEQWAFTAVRHLNEKKMASRGKQWRDTNKRNRNTLEEE
jgi:hypothetical protein